MDEAQVSTPQRRRRHRSEAAALAGGQGGVITRSQLHAVGMSSAAIRANIVAQRWQAIGAHCICVTTGPLTLVARQWVAVLEAGPRAYLDGESALVAAGLRNYTPAAIRVSVPRGARIRHRGTGVNIRQTRRWDPETVDHESAPRARAPGAAVRAGLWARSNRQASLLVTMTVQQGLASVEEIAAELLKVRRDRRRGLMAELLLDLAGGVGSLGELDVLRGCRERGLPAPDSQVVRRTDRGAYYLDLRWRHYRVTVEVDGIQHGWVENAVGDALRHNAIAMDGDVVLRLPVLGLKVCPDEFFGQISKALRRRGWAPTDAPRAPEDVIRHRTHQSVSV